MIDTDCKQRLDEHDERLTAVEDRLDSAESTVDRISRDIIAIRAEGQARSQQQMAGLDRLGVQIQGLTVQLAEHTGAQKRQTELDEAKTRRLARTSFVLGGGCAIIGALLSWQEIASFLWVHILHLHEPWAN